MNRGMRRFFIILAVIAVVAIAFLVIHFIAGGSDSSDSDKSENGTQTIIAENEDYDSVSIKGYADVTVSRSDDEDGQDGIYTALYQDDSETPTYQVTNNTLTIEMEGASISEDNRPELVIYVPEDASLDALEVATYTGDVSIGDVAIASVDISLSNGDVELNGAECDDISVESSYGDVTGTDIESKGITLKLASGDIEFKGKISGDTDVVTASGDVSIETSLSESEYTLDVHTDYGEAKIGDKGYGTQNVSEGSGSNLLKLRTSSGDIDVEFGK